MYSVWCYLQCQALTGGLGVHSLWFREDNHMWKQVERLRLLTAQTQLEY